MSEATDWIDSRLEEQEERIRALEEQVRLLSKAARAVTALSHAAARNPWLSLPRGLKKGCASLPVTPPFPCNSLDDLDFDSID